MGIPPAVPQLPKISVVPEVQWDVTRTKSREVTRTGPWTLTWRPPREFSVVIMVASLALTCHLRLAHIVREGHTTRMSDTIAIP